MRYGGRGRNGPDQILSRKQARLKSRFYSHCNGKALQSGEVTPSDLHFKMAAVNSMDSMEKRTGDKSED